MRRGSRGATSTLRVLVAVLGGVMASVTISPRAAPAETPPPGAVLVAIRSLGQVDAVLDDSTVQVLARGLASPVGLVVLDDGTVLVAESGAGRVSGFGGRLGPTPEPVASVPAPTGLALGPNDEVYVTSAGEVGRIDLATRQYTTLATGLAAPSGPTVRDGALLVPDFATGDLATIDATTGAVLAPLATGLRAPAGAATASGLPVFVAEAQGNAVVRIDPAGGAPSVLASVQGPLQLALDVRGSGDDDWTLVVATVEGIVRLDGDGQVVDRTSLPATTGVAVVPALAEQSSDGASGAATSDEPEGRSSSAPVVVLVGLGAIVAIVAIVAVVLLARRAGRREREDGDLMSPPDAGGLASGPADCADVEREVERLRELLRHVRAQRDDARARSRRAAELASDARHRAVRALEVRTSMKGAREQAPPVADDERLRRGDLVFSSDDGRRAFDAYRRGEIDGATLKRHLTDLGELTAIAQISDAGRRALRADRTVPWIEERNAVRDAVAARDELRVHEHEVHESSAEVEQLRAREAALVPELEAAERRLADCRGTTPAPPPPPPPPG